MIDTGIGIAEEDQRRIFESFQQVDNSMTRRHEGTGLGVTISKQLIALMGGELRLQSSPGRGSRFWFTLEFGVCGAEEIAREAPGADNVVLFNRPSKQPRHDTPLTILVAEDNAVNRKVTSMILEKCRPPGPDGIQRRPCARSAGDPRVRPRHRRHAHAGHGRTRRHQDVSHGQSHEVEPGSVPRSSRPMPPWTRARCARKPAPTPS
ncbi:MAG: ATP-binding protein [Gammaproteobacteria bacterium]|nr:ATP-binding protein [Gammaproteobacteria bacterium]